MIRHGYDDVRGVIIGGDFVSGTLHSYRDGAQQGPAFAGDDDEDVKRQAKAWYDARDGKRIWPQGLELRLRG